MRTRIEHSPRLRRQRVADLRNETEELERRLSDARASLQRELGSGDGEPAPARLHGAPRVPHRAAGRTGQAGSPAEDGPSRPSGGYAGYGSEVHGAGGYGAGDGGSPGYGGAVFTRAGYVGAGYRDAGADCGDASYGDADYGDADYGDADYTEADHRDADYRDADYRDADYRDADYRDADYREADYREADYREADYGAVGYGAAGYGETGNEEAAYRETSYEEAGCTAAEYARASYGHGGYGGPDGGCGSAGAAGYAVAYATPGPAAAGYGSDDGGSLDGASGHGDTEQGLLQSAEERTEVLVTQGRSSVFRPGLSRGSKTAIAVATATCVVIGILLMLLSGSDAAWPPSVATVQKEAAAACLNPNVRSEPGQVNFACGKDTTQILWVFALLTSNGNPNFTDPKTGRVGLEPITPAQGGEVAWSLNLHHPYDPASPIDSLEVAARAINNIIGGATVTGTDGRPVVQPGLESDPANCQRYTGSPALSARQGFPALCARPVTSPAGQAALVADVYRKWIVGATPAAARDAAVLFGNAQHPGDPRVQGILRHLLNSGPSA